MKRALSAATTNFGSEAPADSARRVSSSSSWAARAPARPTSLPPPKPTISRTCSHAPSFLRHSRKPRPNRHRLPPLPPPRPTTRCRPRGAPSSARSRGRFSSSSPRRSPRPTPTRRRRAAPRTLHASSPSSRPRRTRCDSSPARPTSGFRSFPSPLAPTALRNRKARCHAAPSCTWPSTSRSPMSSRARRRSSLARCYCRASATRAARGSLTVRTRRPPHCPTTAGSSTACPPSSSARASRCGRQHSSSPKTRLTAAALSCCPLSARAASQTAHAPPPPPRSCRLPPLPRYSRHGRPSSRRSRAPR